jgi:formate-dependent nitrite reductase membrane component NrfD
VLAAPRAIPYWHSPAVPLQFLFSSLAMGLGVIFFLEVVNDEPITGGQLTLMAVFIILLGVVMAWHLVTDRDVPGKSHSIERLLRGVYRWRFVGGVVVLGTALPLLLTFVAMGAESARDPLAVVIAALLVAGGAGLRLYTLRVGIFPPVRLVSHNGQVRVATG